MKIYLGTDHAGFELKEKVKVFLEQEINCEVEDCGAFELNENDDYPDFIFPVAEKVAKDWKNGVENLGIIFGGSGQGEAMVANRVNGVRATVYYGGLREIIRLSKEHNNANVLSLGGRFISFEEVKKVIKLWLETDFSGEERHLRRIEKINNLNKFFLKSKSIKKYIFISFSILLTIVIFLAFFKNNQNQCVTVDVEKNKEFMESISKKIKTFWISTPQGDFVEDTRNPNEVCLNLQKSKGFENCDLIEAKKSQNNKEECINSESPAGCFACKISCFKSDSD